jgi:hypothetical protein
MRTQITGAESLKTMGTLPKDLCTRRRRLAGAQPKRALPQEYIIRHSGNIETRGPAGRVLPMDSHQKNSSTLP